MRKCRIHRLKIVALNKLYYISIGLFGKASRKRKRGESTELRVRRERATERRMSENLVS